MCITNGTVVTLTVSLGSCVNELGPVAYHATQSFENGELSGLSIVVNALEMKNERADQVRCFAPPVTTAQIVLPMMFGDEKSIELTVLE